MRRRIDDRLHNTLSRLIYTFPRLRVQLCLLLRDSPYRQAAQPCWRCPACSGVRVCLPRCTLQLTSGSLMRPSGNVDPSFLAASGSCTPPVRVDVLPRMSASSVCSILQSYICVFAIDGATPQTLMPCGAYSIARALVAPSAPAFDALHCTKLVTQQVSSLRLTHRKPVLGVDEWQTY